jgi:sortase (surface protein transpeptidase)
VSRRLAAGLLVASALVAAATPVVVRATRPRADVGSLSRFDVLADRTATPVALAPADAGSRPMSSLTPAITIAVQSVRLEDYEPATTGPSPVRLTIDAIGVRAPVVPVGVEHRSGAVDVPADVDTVGWYRFGPSPGMRGSAVLLGHVDSRVHGAGIFFRLRELEPGQTVTVTFANGSTRSFRVVARRSYAKTELPPMVFERAGRARLVLVTCGGSFDDAAGSYSDNVVVFAVPRS